MVIVIKADLPTPVKVIRFIFVGIFLHSRSPLLIPITNKSRLRGLISKIFMIDFTVLLENNIINAFEHFVPDALGGRDKRRRDRLF
jgi:hypothetical protein